MVARKHIVTGAVAAAAAVIAALCLFKSDTTKVKKQFDRLSDLVSKSGEEQLFDMARRAQGIGALFDKQCTLATPLYDFSGVYDRAEIVSNAGRMRAQFSTVSLVFSDVTVEFPDPTHARAVGTLRLRGNVGSSEGMNEVREFECALNKVEGKWLFANWNVVEVLKR